MCAACAEVAVQKEYRPGDKIFPVTYAFTCACLGRCEDGLAKQYRVAPDRLHLDAGIRALAEREPIRIQYFKKMSIASVDEPVTHTAIVSCYDAQHRFRVSAASREFLEAAGRKKPDWPDTTILHLPATVPPPPSSVTIKRKGTTPSPEEPKSKKTEVTFERQNETPGIAP
jgi:hypothetical protein